MQKLNVGLLLLPVCKEGSPIGQLCVGGLGIVEWHCRWSIGIWKVPLHKWKERQLLPLEEVEIFRCRSLNSQRDSSNIILVEGILCIVLVEGAIYRNNLVVVETGIRLPREDALILHLLWKDVGGEYPWGMPYYAVPIVEDAIPYGKLSGLLRHSGSSPLLPLISLQLPAGKQRCGISNCCRVCNCCGVCQCCGICQC